MPDYETFRGYMEEVDHWSSQAEILARSGGRITAEIARNNASHFQTLAEQEAGEDYKTFRETYDLQAH